MSFILLFSGTEYKGAFPLFSKKVPRFVNVFIKNVFNIYIDAGKNLNYWSFTGKAGYCINLIAMKIEYHNLYTHFVLTTRGRVPIIMENSRARIEKYITGIVNNNDSRLYSVYANPEHVYILASRSPRLSEEALATIIADSSAKFINSNRLCPGLFEWQESAAAFSVSKTDVDRVCRYILNQPVPHKKITFAEEYENLIKHYQKTLKWQIKQ